MKRKNTSRLAKACLYMALASLPILPGHAQDGFLPASTHDPSVQSPQIATIMRHDQTQVDLSTGAVSLNIPLVRWKDKDFDCPVSLSYHSAGFRPREVDNYVGRDWMLNVGGVVYRKVNGVPDDIDAAQVPIAADAGVGSYVSGFLSVLGKGVFNTNVMLSDYKQNPHKYAKYKQNDDNACMPTIPGMTKDIEPSADVFYFSFGKHSGKFMINFDGTVSAMGYDGAKYEVDLSSMKTFFSTAPQDTHIRILTDDGYTYTFGGDGYSSLEYNALAWKDFFYNGIVNPPYARNEITAYYLTEIMAPNGRTMKFVYRDNVDPDYHLVPGRLNNIRYEKTPAQRDETALHYSLSGKSKYQAYRAAPLASYMTNLPFEPEVRPSYTLTKVALLDHIKTDQGGIRFHYSLRDQHISYTGKASDEGTFPYICGAKLDAVELIDSEVESTTLNYTYQCGKRMFLESVKTREGIYRFQYKANSGLTAPSPLTYNIDHWGFWRGSRQNRGIVPAMKPDPVHPQDYTITSDDRNPTGEAVDYSLLEKMYLPTGGYTTFEYESHQYSKLPERTWATSYYLKGKYPEGKQYDIAGGARIRAVTHYDQDAPVKKTVYTYGYITYMGELTYIPCYKYLAFRRKPGTTTELIDFICFDSEGITDLPYPSVHIRYPQVTEHYVNPVTGSTSEAHPYKTTDFDGYIATYSYNYTDDFSYATDPTVNFLNPDVTYVNSDTRNYNRNLLAHPTRDLNMRYGKIVKESFYDAQRHLVAQTEYQYDYQNKQKCSLRQYTAAPHFGLGTGLYSHFVAEPFHEYAPVKKVTSTSVPSGQAARKQEFFKYDAEGYLAENASPKTDGDTLITTYSHRYNRDTFRMQVVPTAISSYLGTARGRQLMERDSTVYSPILSLPTKGAHWAPKRFVNYAPDGQVIHRTDYGRYDYYGNPLEISHNDEKPTIYVWGYYGQYLQALVENSSYNEVRAAMAKAPEAAAHDAEGSPQVDFIRLRLPHAHAYTYAYKTGIGMIRETNPAGKTLYYQYDTKKRLQQVYRTGENGKREILQLNHYHLINE